MNDLLLILMGGTMFGAGALGMRAIYRPMIDAAYELAESKIESTTLGYEIQMADIRKKAIETSEAFEEMSNLRQKEIELSEQRYNEKHQEVIELHANYTQQISDLNEKLLKSKKRHKKGSILFNNLRKECDSLFKDHSILQEAHKNVTLRKDVLEAELQMKDVHLTDLQETARKDLDVINQKAIKFEKEIRQETKEMLIKEELRNSSLMADNMQLRKKIKRINRRRKVASQITRGQLKEEQDKVYRLEGDVEEAARVIRNLRNTR